MFDGPWGCTPHYCAQAWQPSTQPPPPPSPRAAQNTPGLPAGHGRQPPPPLPARLGQTMQLQPSRHAAASAAGVYHARPAGSGSQHRPGSLVAYTQRGTQARHGEGTRLRWARDRAITQRCHAAAMALGAVAILHAFPPCPTPARGTRAAASRAPCSLANVDCFIFLRRLEGGDCSASEPPAPMRASDRAGRASEGSYTPACCASSAAGSVG